MAFPEIADIVHLQPGGRRQDDIGQFGRRGQKEIGHGHEIHLFQGPVDLPGIGPGDHRVGADKKKHLDRIRFFGEDGVPDRFGLDDGKTVGQTETFSPQTFGRLLRGQHPVSPESAHIMNRWGFEKDLPAGTVDISGDPHEAQ